MTCGTLDGSACRVGLAAPGMPAAERTLVERVLADAGVQLVAAMEADVVVVDLRRGDDRGPGTGRPTIGLIDAIPQAAVRRLLGLGLVGVVAWEKIERSLGPAVMAVLGGLTVFPTSVLPGVLRPALSAREKQVLSLVVMGLTNAEIGRRLYLAESTIKYHLLSIYDKLGVRSRREAADLAVDPQSGVGFGVLELTGLRPGGTQGYEPPRVGP